MFMKTLRKMPAKPAPSKTSDRWYIDLGRASRKTRGFYGMLFYENGFPPFNTTWFGN